MIVIQISSLYFVDLANTRNAMFLVGESLIATAGSFNNQIVTRNDALSQAGRLLSGDFAFKTAYASTSSATIRSALDNHRQRIGADLMLLLSLQGETIASSGRAAGNFSEADGMFALPDFVQAAITEGGAAGMVSRNNAVYSVIAVPLLTPVPSAWIILGFEVNDSLINKLQEDSHADISIAAITGDHWNINISTLEPAIQTSLTTALNRMPTLTETTIDLNLDGTHWFTFISQLPAWGETPLYAVLQRSGNEALAPYYRIRLVLIGLLIAALIISIVAGGAIASSVTRPVQMLVSYARQIQRGEYRNEIKVEQKDELGHLAGAFNDMSRGLYERDKVRNLLGKVISPEIAEELINKDLQLGGEERELTVLFTDLRNFTGLSEHRSPSEVLDLLNEYLTRMTAVIDRYGGVVDKYIGDAIMALFGAPLALPNHAENAVLCAMEMTRELDRLNREFQKQGLPELGMGIGINTGNVVVGNMGSRDRLNYTVIGDNVNLASRLETETKNYNTPIIVSETTRNLTTGIEFRKLDHITVKGKQVPVTIYTPMRS